ncbi:hypothetical protein TT95_00034 [Camelpox virus]|uniref:Uncharacterized protein n=1 Tax=Camelpox virus TaxID=28873 RepID=A0A0K1LD18_9POXV|nr:hypothetical protein TT95_00034 [Camelpox virus]WIG62228.1 hypothetical protein DIBLKBHL_00029 [Camelpox virus]
MSSNVSLTTWKLSIFKIDDVLIFMLIINPKN